MSFPDVLSNYLPNISSQSAKSIDGAIIYFLVYFKEGGKFEFEIILFYFSLFSGPEHHHLHHPPLEASLSHCTGDSNPGMNQANKHQSSHFFSSRQHATITSNSAASLEMAAASQLQVPIKGKLLSLRLKKGQIDKAHKDKTSQRFPDNFSVTLFLVKPEDQSEKLLDYSLYSPAFLMQSMPDQVGILLLDIFLVRILVEFILL